MSEVSLLEKYLSISVSIAFWYIYYRLICLILPHKEPEFCNRMVTLLHGATTTIMGVNQCFGEESIYEMQGQTPFHTWLLIYSLGYFFFDTFWCMLHQTETGLIMCHHYFTCIGLWRVITKNLPGAQSTCALGFLELSNPLLQMRWFARSEGMEGSPYFLLLEVAFVLVFLFARIFFGTYYMYKSLTSKENSLEFKFICFTISVISWFLVVGILKFISKKVHRFQTKFLQPRARTTTSTETSDENK